MENIVFISYLSFEKMLLNIEEKYAISIKQGDIKKYVKNNNVLLDSKTIRIFGFGITFNFEDFSLYILSKVRINNHTCSKNDIINNIFSFTLNKVTYLDDLTELQLISPDTFW